MTAWLIALAVLLALAPAVAWLGRRHGRRLRSGLGLASLLLGLGEAVDPPSSHMIEAETERNKARPAPGDPPAD